jgi:hypothetical protein
MVAGRVQGIIKELAENKIVEELVSNITKTNSFEINDLIQDIYVFLMEYEDDKIVELYEKNQLKYFIVRMIYNNYFSVNSRYYYKYKKFINNSTQIEDLYDKV